MEADFSGYASRSGRKCSDGRTILAGAFKHQDKTKVPLVWSHQHDGVHNILGHAILEDRPDGVFAHGFFNDTDMGQTAKKMVQHGDIEALSIYAKKLTERSKNVMHGQIVEVSLVMLGANPGAMIENVNISHGDVSETLDDEAIIYTDESDLELTHADDTEGEPVGNTIQHEDTSSTSTETESAPAGEKSIKDVYEAMSDEQKTVVHYLVGEVATAGESDDDDEGTSDTNIQHSSLQEGSSMGTRTIFDKEDTNNVLQHSLTGDDLRDIMREGDRLGSLKEAFLAHAESNDYGIENIEYLFPDAKNLTTTPEFLQRRTEWVAKVMSKTKHSPFSRIKTLVADITADEARAKGYVKGNLKKDEIFKLLKRVTTPTTIYKKQKLDRDDILDITDFDVIVWVKAEMRLMLEEEVARAILIGDGREIDDEDKIDEDKLRPIAFDADMYSHKVDLDSNIDPVDIIDEVLLAQDAYKGTGTPDFYTTNKFVIRLMLLKDKFGRRLYPTRAELAAALGVNEIISVEVMDSTPGILGIIVNLADYTVGADKGGQTTFFEDFDIDYNQQKYLLETRLSGALTKIKSAIVIRREVGNVVDPQVPTFVQSTNTITIPTQTGVKYFIDDAEVAAGPKVIVEDTEVEARPAAGYRFEHLKDTDWVYTFRA